MVDRLAGKQGGLNLTFAVRDGIVYHCGESFDRILTPDRLRRPSAVGRHVREALPATLEGCLVRMVDKIAYLGRDVEDAITAKVISEKDLPECVEPFLLKDGTFSDGQFVAACVADVIESSYDEDKIAVSEELDQRLQQLYDFNMERVYRSPVVQRYFDQVQRTLVGLLDHFATRATDSLKGEKRESDRYTPWCEKIFDEFYANTAYGQNGDESTPGQIAVDFVSGMTDNFAVKAYQEIFLPRAVDAA